MTSECRNCTFWQDEDWCILKDMYTKTEPDHKCDETNFRGESYFTERPKIPKKPADEPKD